MPYPAYSKEELRRMYQVVDSPEPPVPTVLARRGIQEAALKWLAKYSPRIDYFCVGIGFFVILLPVFLKPWGTIIKAIPVLAYVHQNFAYFPGQFLHMTYMFSALLFLSALWGTNSGYSQQEPPIPIPLDVLIKLELYPKTRKQEISFWINFFRRAWNMTIYLFLFTAVTMILTLGRR